MDIIQMPIHIVLIANDMIPEAVLPDATVAIVQAVTHRV